MSRRNTTEFVLYEKRGDYETGPVAECGSLEELLQFLGEKTGRRRIPRSNGNGHGVELQTDGGQPVDDPEEVDDGGTG